MAEAEAEIEKLKGLYEGKSMSECFARLHYRTENSIVEIRNEVKEMKEEFENLKQYAENIDEAVKDINEKTIENLKTQLSDETKKWLELEQWSRKWNVIIRGIEGQLDESPAVTESKVREFMVNVLKLPKTKKYGSVSSSVGKSNGPSVDSSDNSAEGPSEEDTGSGDTGDSMGGAKNVAASGSSDVEMWSHFPCCSRPFIVCQVAAREKETLLLDSWIWETAISWSEQRTNCSRARGMECGRTWTQKPVSSVQGC